MTFKKICPCAQMGEIKKILEDCNQVHLLKYYKELSETDKTKLYEQLKSIDFKTANELFQEAQSTLDNQSKISGRKIEPVAISDFGSALKCKPGKLKTYWHSGLKIIADGKVAALVLSGGQGTRLGLNIPKAMISIDLPSGKTIFQIHLERIKRLEKLSSKFTQKGAILPLYVLTSEATDDQLKEFLKENNNFGHDKDNIIFFKQGMNPCFDFDGKIILSDKSSIAMAPDGTGGLYKAMEKSGIFEDMKKRGIEYVYVYPVDNILAKVADPFFIGYCSESQTDCAAKVVRKHKAKQNVGNICKVDGKYSIVEYSEMSDELATLIDDNDELLFHSGSICIHVFTVDFMKRMAQESLPVHVAKKKVSYIDEDGVIIKPSTPNAIKIEKFVFEAFPYANNFVTWEVGYDEFSPVKNSNIEKYECPLTARADLLSVHKKYIQQHGANVDENAEVEISPLASYVGEDLGQRVRGLSFVPFSSTHIQSEDEYKGHQVDSTFKSFSQILEIVPTMLLEG